MDTPRYGMQFIKMIERERKPRKKGLTLISDKGLGYDYVRGFLEGYGDYVDYVKFFHMTPRIVPEDLTRKKLELYRANAIKPFAGGIYLELAYCQEQVDRALAYIRDLGFSAIELSANFVDFSSNERRELIEQIGNHGLEVIYEFGRKYYGSGESLDIGDVAGEIKQVLSLGAVKVILEESVLDLLAGERGEKPTAKKLVDLANTVGVDDIIFEPSARGQYVWLINTFGPDVNLGPNIDPEAVMWLEPGRLGIGRAFGYSWVVRQYEEFKQRQERSARAGSVR
jgi:phosphosulfolactate synthase